VLVVTRSNPIPPAGARVLDRRSLLVASSASVAALATSGLIRSYEGMARSNAVQDDSTVELVVASNWPVVDMDPHSVYDSGSALAMTGVFEGLIKLKPGTVSEFESSLAESWKFNDDLSVWTFHLRPGVRFHDGSPVDAEAVRASFERLFTLALAPSSVLGRFITSIDQISVSDPQTIVFDLGRPQLLFESAMATPFGTAIVNAALAKTHEVDGDWGHAWAQSDCTGMGTGPYQANQSDIEDTTQLTRFDDYWGGWSGSHIDRVVLRVVDDPETRLELIERGDADIVFNTPLTAIAELEQNTDVSVVRETNLMVQYFAMTIAGLLVDPDVRRALCYAFPYDDVLNGVLLGYAKPAKGPVNERCRGFAESARIYATDLTEARRLLDAAGVSEGTKLSVAVAAGNAENQAIAEVFQVNLQQIGIDLEIQNLDIGAYVQMAFGDMPAEERVSFFPASWGPDYDDAYNHLWPQVSCNAWQSGNAGQYCNDRVEELLDSARDAADEATYERALEEIQRILSDDDPAAIYFAQPEWITVLRADVDGYVMNPVVSSLFDWYALSRG
jgi:peptide/nickel transport system substrate-binding protein